MTLKNRFLAGLNALVILVFSFFLQFNAAGAQPQNKAYMSLVRDSGYYCLYNNAHKSKKALYMLQLDKAEQF